MAKSALVVIVAMFYALAIAGERAVDMRAVISEQYPGTNVATDEKKVVTFLPGLIVSIDRISDSGTVHVWGADGTTGNLIPHVGVWLPRNILAIEHDFKRLDKWEGDKDLLDESPDMSVKYTLAPDGGVTAVFSDQSSESAKRRGHLYRFKNLLWIKVFKDEHLLGQNIFLILPSGKLCSRNRPEGEGLDCPAPVKR